MKNKNNLFQQMGLLVLIICSAFPVLCQIPQRSGSGNLFYDTLKINLYNPPAWNWQLNCTFFKTENLPDHSMVIQPGYTFSLFNGNQSGTAVGMRSMIIDTDYHVINAWKPLPYLRKEHWISRTGRFIIRTIDMFSDYDLEWTDEMIYDFGLTYRKEKYFEEIYRSYPASLFKIKPVPDFSILKKSGNFTPVQIQDTIGLIKSK